MNEVSLMPGATLRIDSPAPNTLVRALLPEVGRELPRTSVDVRVEEGRFVLDVRAGDLSALRAAVNSYLRWIKVSKEIIELTGG